MVGPALGQTGSAPSKNPSNSTRSTLLPPGTNEITFAEFLERVATENLGYASQRYNVPIAEAAVAAAREFQNPTLQFGAARDVTHSGNQRMPDTYNLSLTQTLELGGKRKYRIRAAKQNYAAAAATLEDYLRNLKLDAAAAFANALALSRSAEQKRQTADYLKRLSDAQRERFRAGDISQGDLLQTHVEEQQFQNELLAAQAESANASIALSGFLGRDLNLLVPKGSLELPAHSFELTSLLAHLESRPDLVALRHVRDAAQSKITEEKRNRIPNLDIGPTWAHSSSSENAIAPSPQFDSVGLGISLPLPLWNRNRAAIASSQFAAEQAGKQLLAAQLKGEVDIRQSFTAYLSAVDRVRHYQEGILKDADSVLESRRFSYQQGQASLLELLDAQRTTNEVRSGYNDALADQAKALIELQRAAGIWEIQF